MLLRRREDASMGADWVCVFNKRLCDQILLLSAANIASFVESHLSALGKFSDFKSGFEENVPASVRVNQLHEQGRTDEELKADLVDHLCVSSDDLIVDYWGCYSEVFASVDPPGSIPDYRLFPHIKEQRYLLLRPEHVGQMLASLEEHWREVQVMQEAQVFQLRQLKTLCEEDSGYMVAYFYDY